MLRQIQKLLYPANSNICFITFGGSPNETDDKYADIEKARERIILQAKASNHFIETIGVNWNYLSSLCVKFKIDVPDNPSRYLFTPILLKLISLNAFGKYDLVLYAGSGCEINTNFFAKFDLRRMIKIAQKNLFYVENTLLPENCFTKQEVFSDLFSSIETENSKQISATFFLVSCNTDPIKLSNISNEWLYFSTRQNGFYLSDKLDSSIQKACFRAHRFDQSLFSMVLKKHQISSEDEKQRNFESYFPALRGATTLIWTNRNRTGVSKLPRNINSFFLGILAIIVLPLTFLRHAILTHKRTRRNFLYVKD